jgi:type VI protein secretion system component Hcp
VVVTNTTVVGQVTIPQINNSQPFSIRGFSWGFSKAGGATTRKPLQIVRGIDGTSVELMQAGLSAQTIVSAKLEVFTPGTSQVFMTYNLATILIAEYHDESLGNSPANPVEKLTINYASITETAGTSAPSTPSGQLDGYVSIPGQNLIPITSDDWSFVLPVTANGQLVGSPQARNFVFTRTLDLNVPTVASAGLANTVWATVTVSLWMPGATAAYATYTLSSATITSLTDSADGSAGGTPFEEVQLQFSKIQLDSQGNSYCYGWTGVC